MEVSSVAKRRFSSMSNGEGIEEQRMQAIAAIENAATQETRRLSVDARWYEDFKRASRKEKMPRMPPQGSGTDITQESFELLSEWYTEVEVKFCVVQGPLRAPIWAAPNAELAPLLDVQPGQTLHMSQTSLDRVSTAEYLRLEPLPLTAGELGSNRVVVVNTKPAGTVGLQNLGNTCYMNSSLQCLLHTTELMAYFLGDKYQSEINADNPIGYGGAAARAFAELAKGVWTCSQSSYSPAMFKATVGRFNRSFAGYLQQDSQEFTAFLLDALHEDLNRIKQKPSTEKPELADDKIEDPEAIATLARECWDLHRKRNDSVVLDLFTGLYKSTLVCPECAKVSITFDPFGDLTLPFPSLNIWLHTIYFIGLDGTMTEFEVALQTHSSIAQLKAQVQQVVGREFGSLVAEIHANKVWQWFQDRDTVGDKICADDVIAVYEVNDQCLLVLFEVDGRHFGWPLMVQFDDPMDARPALEAKIGQVLEETAPFKIFKHRRSSFSDSTTYIRFEPYEVEEHADTLQIVSPKSEEPFEIVEPEQNEAMASEGPSEDPFQDPMGDPTPSEGQGPLSPQSESDPSSGPSVGPTPQSEPWVPTANVPHNEPAPTAPTELARPALQPLDVLSLRFENYANFKQFSQLSNPLAAEAAEKRKLKPDLGLDDLLELFSTPEVLGENDLWYCGRCKEFRNATKKIELWKTPDMFTVHLKRFRDIQSSRDKINDVVNFPIEGLDITKRVLGADGPQIYDLYAVDNHFGGLGGGHYTAFALNPVDKKWYYFNDSSVSNADPEDSINGAAYLLFYRRRGLPTVDLSSAVTAVRDQRLREQQEEQERQREREREQQAQAASQTQDRWGQGHVLGPATQPSSQPVDSPAVDPPVVDLTDLRDDSSTISDMST